MNKSCSRLWLCSRKMFGSQPPRSHGWLWFMLLSIILLLNRNSEFGRGRSLRICLLCKRRRLKLFVEDARASLSAGFTTKHYIMHCGNTVSGSTAVGNRLVSGRSAVYPRDDGRSDTMVVGLVDGRLMTLKTLFIQGMSGNSELIRMRS